MKTVIVISLYVITYFIYILVKTLVECNRMHTCLISTYFANLIRNIPIVIGCAIGAIAAFLFCTIVKWECNIGMIYPLYMIVLFSNIFLSIFENHKERK